MCDVSCVWKNVSQDVGLWAKSKMSAYGLNPAFLVRQARSKPTSVPVFYKSLFPVEGSAIFMLTLLDLFPFLAVLIICLPWWIILLEGWRLFLSHQSLLLAVHRPWFFWVCLLLRRMINLVTILMIKFVCEDWSPLPLQPLYRGPYLFLLKYFTLQLGALEDRFQYTTQTSNLY